MNRHYGWPLLALTLLTGGCSQPPVSKDTFYRLSPPPALTRADTPRKGVADVRVILADGVLGQRAIAYQTDDEAHSLQQYSYHFWTDTPPQAIQLSLADYLRQAGLFEAVVTPDYRVMADYDVQGRLLRLDHIPGPGESRALVSLELAISEKKDPVLLLHKTYRVEKAARDDSVAAMSLAASGALKDIFDQFAADIAALPPPARRPGHPLARD